MPKQPLIIVGVSGAGKSTLAQKLAQEFGLKIIDVFEYAKPYIEKHGSAKVKGNLLKRAYEDLIKDLPNLNFDILEIASDWPDEFLPKIINRIKKEPILVLVYSPLDICLSRNTQRNRQVPKEIVREQANFTPSFYNALAQKLDMEFKIVNSRGSVLKSYQSLKNVLRLKK